MKRFTILEGYRGLLAWWVVLAHTLSYAGFKRGYIQELVEANPISFAGVGYFLNTLFINLLPWLHNGKLPVYVFMMLSGFVITHLIAQKKEPYSVYILRRFLRLWPALMVVLIVVAGFRLAGEALHPFHRASDFWTHFALESTLMFGLIPDQILNHASDALSGPGWSISLEWQFYLVAPFLIAAFTQRNWKAWLVLLVLVACAYFGALNTRGFQFAGQAYTWPHPAALPHVIGYFMLGMVSYFAFSRLKKQKNLSLAALLVSILGAYHFLGPEGGFVPLSIWALVMASMLSVDTLVNRLMESKILSWLGTRSYSTYITHIWVVSAVDRFVLRRNDFGDLASFERFWFLLLFSWPVVIFISILMYLYVEKPGIRLGRHLAKRLRN